MNNPSGDDEKERFVELYTKTNRGKTKTEALQEWNRIQAANYISGFTGDISLGNLEPDTKRNILSRIPGGRYSVLTAKQTQLNINKQQLCEYPISVKEFKSYLLKRAQQYLDTDKQVDINFICSYKLIVNQETKAVKKNYPELHAEMVDLAKEYNGDKRFPIVTNLTIYSLDEEDKNKDKYCFLHIVNTAFAVFRSILRPRDVAFNPIVGKEKIHNLDLPHYIPKDKDGITRKTELISLLKGILDNIKFEDLPDVIVDPETTLDILRNRKDCKLSEELYNKVYNRKELYRKLLVPIPPTIDVEDKSNVITSLKHTHGQDLDLVEIENEYYNKEDAEEFEEDTRIKDLFDKYGL